MSILFHRRRLKGFTLLEVMVAMAIIAIAFTAVLGSQSQSVSLASEARFSTTAALLAQAKMAELEAKRPEDLASASGDFGEDYPEYTWEVKAGNVMLDEPKHVGEHLVELDLVVSWGDGERYAYHLKRYCFLPKKRG
jgi:general secretion pathway protein I